jgi:preprotein translocase subunit SecY
LYSFGSRNKKNSGAICKRNIVQGGKMMQAGGVRQYLPLKLNASGVMPIIFAQAIMFLPATIAQFLAMMHRTAFGIDCIERYYFGFLQRAVFLLIVAFTYFYTALDH